MYQAHAYMAPPSSRSCILQVGDGMPITCSIPSEFFSPLNMFATVILANSNLQSPKVATERCASLERAMDQRGKYEHNIQVTPVKRLSQTLGFLWLSSLRCTSSHVEASVPGVGGVKRRAIVASNHRRPAASAVNDLSHSLHSRDHPGMLTGALRIPYSLPVRRWSRVPAHWAMRISNVR